MRQGRVCGTLVVVAALDHVVIHVDDWESTIRFYTGLLGVDTMPSPEACTGGRISICSNSRRTRPTTSSARSLRTTFDLDRLIAQIAGAMRPGGSLVFSVEHPIYSAPTNQSFVTTDGGDRVWPLDNYLVEGERTRTWFVDGVIKQHRTIATYVNTLVAVGLTVEQLVEWGPTAAAMKLVPSSPRTWIDHGSCCCGPTNRAKGDRP
ncbi:MAG: hypothetical protein R2710_08230 [Acidimicrobiales bacterium]